ncbi:hypothetical protein D3C83_65020 [compost metagenome]
MQNGERCFRLDRQPTAMPRDEPRDVDEIDGDQAVSVRQHVQQPRVALEFGDVADARRVGGRATQPEKEDGAPASTRDRRGNRRGVRVALDSQPLHRRR